jgi:hypothetical protein
VQSQGIGRTQETYPKIWRDGFGFVGPPDGKGAFAAHLKAQDGSCAGGEARCAFR